MHADVVDQLYLAPKGTSHGTLQKQTWLLCPGPADVLHETPESGFRHGY